VNGAVDVRYLIILGVASLLLIGAIVTTAQTEVSDATCSAALNTIWTTASDACVGKPSGYLCNGGGVPAVEPAGPVSNALAAVGALVEVQAVASIRTPPVTIENVNGGVAWLRLPDPLNVSGLMIGDVLLRDVTPPDFPAWQSMVVQTGVTSPACNVAPRNAFILQSPVNGVSGIVVNGASLVLNGTVMVQTTDAQTMFISLAGQSRVLARGQEYPLITGEQITVPYNPGDLTTPAGPPSSPIPLDVMAFQHIPIALMERPFILPQPGYVSTAGQVNLRSRPSADADLLMQVPAGQVMSVLGRNPAGDWYHVRLNTGETGWMLADLLQQNLGAVQAVYEATPLPPQRYGSLGLLATVIAPAGANLRQAPDVTFALVTTIPAGTQVYLVARSPYNPWVKVEAGGVVGWTALITLETQAVIEALPVDYDVPPPPEPTRVPGSFGNAFPDPNLNNND
jgi:uncharacterized protein YgiM (DUF1202 family)